MKPSPFFSNHFRYFFKRFRSEKSLRHWFLKRAGGESSLFSYPKNLRHFEKTLVFFPEEPESAKKIIRAFQKIWNKNSTFAIANSSLQASLLQEKIPARVHYLKPIDYRFGEEKFIQLDLEISKFSPNLVLFFSKNHLPALYLARHSLAECRIGFEKNAYPFLNTFFSAQNLNEALSLLLEQYGENHGG